jgi:hypothetical protein
MVLPASPGVSRVPGYSGTRPRRCISFRLRGSHPLRLLFPEDSTNCTFCNFAPDLQFRPSGPTTPREQRLQSYTRSVWAIPRSLAATRRVSIDFLSYRYLDVSVPCVGPQLTLGDVLLWTPGFPIRVSSDHSSLASSPKLIAGSYALLRLLMPRHPPCALSCLFTKNAP